MSPAVQARPKRQVSMDTGPLKSARLFWRERKKKQPEHSLDLDFGPATKSIHPDPITAPFCILQTETAKKGRIIWLPAIWDGGHLSTDCVWPLTTLQKQRQRRMAKGQENTKDY